MSLNLGSATTALNNFFANFAPQRWKQDLFYRNIRDSDGRDPVEYVTQTNSGKLSQNDVFNKTKDYISGQFKGFSSNRGVLMIDENTFDKSKALFFQFNPENITDQKSVEYADRQKPGFDNADYIWSKGGARTITFELMLDASLSSYTQDILTSNPYTHNPDSGTLNQTEFLQSLIRPYHSQGGDKVPQFSSNGVKPNLDRFASPPQVAFSYGKIYLKGVITDLSIEHEAFNRNLAPIRSKANITFRVREDLTVEKADNFLSTASIGAVAYDPQTLKSVTG